MEFSSQNFASPIRAFFISSSTLKFGSSFDIDKALVSQIAPLLPTLAELIGDDALNGMGQLVKSILKAFPEAMEKTTKFEVGLKLIK